MLDKLPAWARHLLIVAGGTFAGTICTAVIGAGGVTDVDWLEALRAAVNLAAVTTATTAAALWLTPLTRKYGVGAQ
jgi:hypothetical protein